jgi:hypothetical protein
MLDGIQYAIGDFEIDDSPSAKSSPGGVALAPEKK